MREVAQIGAVAGREFHYELLNAVAGLPKERLDEALAQLVQSELVFRRGENPHAVYTFKHTLVRDAAYAGLLKSRRAQLHAAIANALEQQFPDVAQTEPETLAHHLTEAGLSEQSGRILAAGRQERGAPLGQSRGHRTPAARHRGDGPPAGRRGQGQVRARSPPGPGAVPDRHARAGREHRPWQPSPARASCASGSGSRRSIYQVMFWLATVSVVRGELSQALEATTPLLNAAEARGTGRR